LAWEILRSDDALLLEEFVDISNRPNAIELGVAGTNASHKVVLDFPEGFVFPYDGGEYTTVAITNSGYLTFDPGSVVATGDLVIPVQNNANGSKLDIAPFWDSMVASDGSDGQLWTLWWEFVEGEVDRI